MDKKLDKILEKIRKNDEHPERGAIYYRPLSYDKGKGVFCRGNRQGGLYEEWWFNGQLSELSNWRNGGKHGLTEYWLENGQLSDRCTYKEGKLDGLCEHWHDNGR
ncbi:toxin-antitoxin system YwqK family antitoxin, partial [Porphyromonas levii]|uniref:toxin-antitoxin system YwqK family antitoxin n=1 Tax=Porphyromonas levii TaxID=28114 RepID=UPI003D1604F2